MSAATILAIDDAALDRAAQTLVAGGLVAVPTETVYGLAARADNSDAVAKIYAAKGRPDFNPLIVHVPDIAAASALAEFSDGAKKVAATFWPGPLTLVLPRRIGSTLAPAVTAGLETVALRCPAHPAMQALLARTGLPLAAPSANRSGGVSPTRAEHVAASLGDRVDMVLDGGACEQGLESTIVAVRRDDSWQVLRPGPIDEAQVAAVLGPSAHAVLDRIEAPGQFASHYAPGKPVRLNAERAQKDEFLIGFGEVAGDCTLSASGDLNEAAARLYDCLHRAAEHSLPRVAVARVPNEGFGIAINDRLSRAAA